MTTTHAVDLDSAALGIELGSTRIKAVLTDVAGGVLATGGHTWENALVDGVWTYSVDDVEAGLRAAFADLAASFRSATGQALTHVGAMGVSAMMHGYLALGTDGELLAPFRTWRNTFTQESAARLSGLLGLNIPQRWSVSHLHHAVAGGEEHVTRIVRLTTLAGYVHLRLTGQHVLGVGDASGMFPIGADGASFDAGMLATADAELAEQAGRHGLTLPWRLADILPRVAVAGQDAGTLTADGAALLDPTGTFQPGALMAPPEGDAGTGMVATGSVTPRTGNVSAGTSAFAMVVLSKPLRSLIEQIDLVATPDGAPVAMAHSNNCTSDLNAWVAMLTQLAQAVGADVPRGRMFDLLLERAGSARLDGGLVSYGFLSGEHPVDVAQGRPMLVRRPEAGLDLGQLMRAHMFSAFASMAYGLRVLRRSEDVPIDSMFAHGGIFKTPVVPQRLLAAAFDTPISVGAEASEGGAWGMALLAGYRLHGAGTSLGEYLADGPFAHAQVTTLAPQPDEVAEFERYLDAFVAALPLERQAADLI